MIAHTQYALILSFAWLCVLTLAYYGFQRTGVGRSHSLRSVLVIAAAIRFVPMLLLPFGAEYDIESFRRVGQTLLEGGEVYTSPLVAGRHPYLPLQLYLVGGAMQLSQLTGLPFVILLKLPSVLADTAIVGLIYRALRRTGRSESQAFATATLYALNPVPVLISAYHGQFDTLTLLLTLLAWYVWQFEPRRPMQSAFWLGLAVLHKTWPLLFLPIMVLRLTNWRSRITFSAVTLAVPVVGILVYMLLWQVDLSILNRPLSHFGVPGWWGLGAGLALLQTFTGFGGDVLASIVPYSRYAVLIAAGGVAWLTRRQPALKSFVTCLLTVYVVTLGFGLQYLVWVVPFAAYLDDRRGLNWFTLGALVYLVVNYYGLHMDPLITRVLEPPVAEIVLRAASIPAWLAAVGWLLARLQRRMTALESRLPLSPYCSTLR